SSPAAGGGGAEGAESGSASRRRGGRDAMIEVAWSIGDAMEGAAAGTRDHFLIERYSLYVTRVGRLYRGRVRHLPYPLCRVAVRRLVQTVVTAAGLSEPTTPPLYHYSPGGDVGIFWLERGASLPG